MSAIQPQNPEESNGSVKDGLCARIIQRIANLLPVRHIRKKLPDGTEAAYLDRYTIIRSKPFAVYLHHFVDRDQDTEMHDHPWHAVSWVITGWYMERYLLPDLQTSERRIRFGNRIQPNRFHMITEAKPGTWTLFIRFKKTKRWGFIGDIHDGQATYRPAVAEEIDTGQHQHPDAGHHVI